MEAGGKEVGKEFVAMIVHKWYWYKLSTLVIIPLVYCSTFVSLFVLL